MDIFRSLTTTNDGQRGSAWDRAENYVKEERPLQPIRKIVVKGAVDVVFRRFNKPQLVVAGETADAVKAVKTYYKGDKLVIEQEGVGGMTITNGNVQMVFHGSVGQFVMGDIVNGQAVGASIGHGHAIVGIVLPQAPNIGIKGSGDVTLLDLQQAGLELEIQGSGDITVFGHVGHLNVEIAGSGDVDASQLVADEAHLSIAGSGDIEAFVRSAVSARVAGSGDIVVRGNPASRDSKLAGSGKVKFR